MTLVIVTVVDDIVHLLLTFTPGHSMRTTIVVVNLHLNVVIAHGSAVELVLSCSESVFG